MEERQVDFGIWEVLEPGGDVLYSGELKECLDFIEFARQFMGFVPELRQKNQDEHETQAKISKVEADGGRGDLSFLASAVGLEDVKMGCDAVFRGDSHASVRTGSELEEKKPCPVERGKLIIGLEFCREKDPERCQDCPYYPVRNYCSGALAGDALAYIGWLEENGFQTGGVLPSVVFTDGKHQAVEITE